MQPRERVFAALEGRPTDKIPIYHLGFSSQVASSVLGREAYVGGGIQQWREASAIWNGPRAHQEFLERSLEDAIAIAQAFDHDLIRFEYWRMPERPTAKIDQHTFEYGDRRRGRRRVLRFEPETELYQVVEQHPPEGEASFETIEAELEEQEREEPWGRLEEGTRWLLETVLERCGATHAIRANAGRIDIPYESQAWFEAVLLRPDLLERHLDLQVVQGLARIEEVSSRGLRLAFGGGDMAYNDGTFYSPEVFRRMLLPRVRTLAKACEERGVHFLYGSDGNLWGVADHLMGRSGISGCYEVDGRAGMDLDRLRRRFPRVALIGNISSQTLHLGTPEEVVAEVRRALDAAKRHGRVIVGVSNYMMPGTPRANLEALRQSLAYER